MTLGKQIGLLWFLNQNMLIPISGETRKSPADVHQTAVNAGWFGEIVFVRKSGLYSGSVWSHWLSHKDTLEIQTNEFIPLKKKVPRDTFISTGMILCSQILYILWCLHEIQGSHIIYSSSFKFLFISWESSCCSIVVLPRVSRSTFEAELQI